MPQDIRNIEAKTAEVGNSTSMSRLLAVGRFGPPKMSSEDQNVLTYPLIVAEGPPVTPLVFCIRKGEEYSSGAGKQVVDLLLQYADLWTEFVGGESRTQDQLFAARAHSDWQPVVERLALNKHFVGLYDLFSRAPDLRLPEPLDMSTAVRVLSVAGHFREHGTVALEVLLKRDVPATKEALLAAINCAEPNVCELLLEHTAQGVLASLFAAVWDVRLKAATVRMSVRGLSAAKVVRTFALTTSPALPVLLEQWKNAGLNLTAPDANTGETSLEAVLAVYLELEAAHSQAAAGAHEAASALAKETEGAVQLHREVKAAASKAEDAAEKAEKALDAAEHLLTTEREKNRSQESQTERDLETRAKKK